MKDILADTMLVCQFEDPDTKQDGSQNSKS